MSEPESQGVITKKENRKPNSLFLARKTMNRVLYGIRRDHTMDQILHEIQGLGLSEPRARQLTLACLQRLEVLVLKESAEMEEMFPLPALKAFALAALLTYVVIRLDILYQFRIAVWPLLLVLFTGVGVLSAVREKRGLPVQVLLFFLSCCSFTAVYSIAGMPVWPGFVSVSGLVVAVLSSEFLWVPVSLILAWIIPKGLGIDISTINRYLELLDNGS